MANSGIQATDPYEAPSVSASAGGPGPLAPPTPAQWSTGQQAFAANASQSEPLYRIQLVGGDDRLYSLVDLQQLANTGILKPQTMVQHKQNPFAVPASQVPGVFSDKDWIVAVLISVILGGLGIDRFYLGHTTTGVLKLVTFAGLGFWWIIDIFLIATRKLGDASGRPLK